jgi:hypothetical protein
MMMLVGFALVSGVVAYNSNTESDQAVSAQSGDNTAKSCFTVVHQYAPTTTESSMYDMDYVAVGGINGSSYVVEYRVRTSSSGSWGSWTTPSESAAASGGGISSVYEYQYDTSWMDPDIYDFVEWRVISDEHEGVNLRTDDDMISVDDANIMGMTALYEEGLCTGEASNEGQWDWATVGYQHP